MPAEYLVVKEGCPPPAPFLSSAVRAGHYVYCSGAVGTTPDKKMVEGTVQDRTRQVIRNIEAVLAGAGMTLHNIVKTNIYLSNLSKDFTAMNEVYSAMMPDPKPARTCVGVAELPAGGTDVEIEVVAYDG